MVTAADRTHLHRDLQQHLDPRAADTLMELLPMTPADQLVTRQDLALFGAALRAELRADMSELRGEMSELRGEMSVLRGEVVGFGHQLDGFAHRLDALIPRLVLTTVGTVAVLVGLVGGASALLS